MAPERTVNTAVGPAAEVVCGTLTGLRRPIRTQEFTLETTVLEIQALKPASLRRQLMARHVRQTWSN
jgi:hypothetical protein